MIESVINSHSTKLLSDVSIFWESSDGYFCSLLWYPVVVIVCFLTVLGGEFLKYMEAFKPFLGIGLKNYAEYQVRSAEIHLTPEPCRRATCT